MAVICPTITASTSEEYSKQIDNVSSFTKRIHIDLMDGILAPTKSVPLSGLNWPYELVADIHVMYQKPMEVLDGLIQLRPNMVIIHAEAEVDHSHFVVHLKDHAIRAGLAILQNTPLDYIKAIAASFDEILVFDGNLGYQGGEADLSQLDKVRQIKELYPDKEIAWDGGINDQNAKQLVEAGVGVLNVGAFIQRSSDPKDAYVKLQNSLN